MKVYAEYEGFEQDEDGEDLNVIKLEEVKNIKQLEELIKYENPSNLKFYKAKEIDCEKAKEIVLSNIK